MTEHDDAVLVRRACAGDRDAFTALTKRHYDRIFRIGARRLGDKEMAKDLAQDVCILLVKKLPSYRGESRFTTWLHRVVVNAAHDAARRRRTRTTNEREYAEADALARAGDADRDAEEAWLWRAIDALPEYLRDTVILVLEEDLTHREVGEMLEIPEGTVSGRMHEVRKRLRVLAACDAELRTRD